MHLLYINELSFYIRVIFDAYGKTAYGRLFLSVLLYPPIRLEFFNHGQFLC